MLGAALAYSALLTVFCAVLAWDNAHLQRKLNIYHQLNKVF